MYLNVCNKQSHLRTHANNKLKYWSCIRNLCSN
nr:MAG TPA: hypothetical protein [Crassvirales sp.]